MSKNRIVFRLVILIVLFSNAIIAHPAPAITHMISIEELPEYSQYPAVVKNIIQESLLLSKKNLTYTYGSADPKNGGMDCSGTIYYLLHHAVQSDAPRQANEMYSWVEKEGKIHHVKKDDAFKSSAFSNLKPGDLLFWSGTYKTNRVPNITHVMLYLGENKQHQPLMFGSSDGRTFQQIKMNGVSVFDFNLPRNGDKASFEAYGCIPKVTC